MTLTSEDLSNFNENLRRYIQKFLERNGVLKGGKQVITRVYPVDQYRSKDLYAFHIPAESIKSRYDPFSAYNYTLTLTDDNTITFADTQAYGHLLNSPLPVYIHAAKIRFLQQYCAGYVDFLVCSTNTTNKRENKILEFFGWTRSLTSNKGYNDHILWTRLLNKPLHERFIKFYEKFSSRDEEKPQLMTETAKDFIDKVIKFVERDREKYPHIVELLWDGHFFDYYIQVTDEEAKDLKDHEYEYIHRFSKFPHLDYHAPLGGRVVKGNDISDEEDEQAERYEPYA